MAAKALNTPSSKQCDTSFKLTPDAYLSGRVKDQITWYDDRSAEHKLSFQLARGFEIAAAAIIPFLALFEMEVFRYVTALTGVFIALVAGVSSFNKYQENWIDCRTTCEMLKREKFLFLTQTKPYHQPNAFNLFVERFESLISKENSQWISRQYQKDDSANADSQTIKNQESEI